MIDNFILPSAGECKDKHAYCKYMNQMGFCKQEKYKTVCCASCNKIKEEEKEEGG